MTIQNLIDSFIMEIEECIKGSIFTEIDYERLRKGLKEFGDYYMGISTAGEYGNEPE